jgi:hypothetical protein
MKLNSLVPLVHVRSVVRSMEFYRKLGFEEGRTHTPEGDTEPVGAWIRGFRDTLLAAGVDAGPIQKPFWAPGGEFRVTDPDGYVLMITHS